MKKIISLLLLLAMALTLFAGCGKTEPPAATPEAPQTPATETPEVPAEPEPIVLTEPEWTEPVYNLENTVEARQQALTAVGMAYYYKGMLNQYGLQDMNVIDEYDGGNLRGRTLERNTPEENTKDLTLYQWCSSYVYDVVYQAMGYQLNGDYVYCRTGHLVKGNISDSKTLIAHQYNLTKNAAKDKPVIDGIIADLRPGDIVTWSGTAGGHSLLVVHDLNGDGLMEVLHRSGGRYDMAMGIDDKESYGIKKENTSIFHTGNNSLYDKYSVSVIRVTNLDPAQYPLTQATQARITWPDLRIDRTVSGGVLGSVVPGGELTYTIEITNHSSQDHKGLPVMDRLDSHCTMLTQDGQPATTTFPVWSVDVKAGETVTLTYTVKVEGNPGEKIVSEGGSVAGIPSNQLVTTIQAFVPTADKLQDKAVVDAAAAASTSAVEFVNKLYEAAFGKSPAIPTAENVWTELHNTQKVGAYTMYRLKEDAASTAMGSMMIHTYVGGRYVLTGPNDRVLENRLEDLQPGDIFVADGIKMGKPIEYYWIFDGEKLLEWNGGKVKELKEKDLVKAHSFNHFVGLRPSLAQ